MSNYRMRNNEGLSYEMNDSKVLANAIIDISKKEGRYIVGGEDLRNYSQALESFYAKDHVNLELPYACCRGYISSLSGINTDFMMPIRSNGWLEPHCTQYADYYMMVPWITREDLVAIYRNSFPLDAMFWKVGEDIIHSIPSLSEEKLQSMEEAYQLALKEFEKKTNTSLNTAEEKGKIYRHRLEIIRGKMIPKSE